MVSSGKNRNSPFISCGHTTRADQLAVLHLKRDHLITSILRSEDTDNEGYDEGKVTNTRFGSFPHRTLIDVPWGSQVRASAVDTGSRGRRGDVRFAKKRKREASPKTTGEDAGNSEDVDVGMGQATSTKSSSGFIYVLPPTPESWTASLPHRTQVVYTPDYSYILQRIRARPGTRLLEAGAGSGSFTHAAARAVFNGFHSNVVGSSGLTEAKGKIWSFEFHEQRSEKLQQELIEHGLDDLVTLTHRDVCEEGFSPKSSHVSEMRVNAVFLDLPAPWLALKYLTRDITSSLDPDATVHICTFSPCIEQIQKTVSTLRQYGWLEIEVVEIAAKRIEVWRERVGLQEEGLRGVNDSPATVDEAMMRLRELESRARSLGDRKDEQDSRNPERRISKQQRLANIRNAQESRKLYKEGRLVTKAESELKTHTSYLVFAVLPRSWTEEDEKAIQDSFSNEVRTKSSAHYMNGKQLENAAHIATETYDKGTPTSMNVDMDA